MTIESVIIAFVVMCGCFIISNILVFPYRASQQKKLEKLKQKFAEAFDQLAGSYDEAAHCANEKKERDYCRWMYRKLRSPLAMIAYAETVQLQLNSCSKAQQRWYLDLVQPILGRLCAIYDRRPVLSMTYFVHVLRVLLAYKEAVFPRIWEFLYVRLRSESLTCRQQALGAIYASGDVEKTVKAIRYMNKYYEKYNDKLITDGLVNFSGDLPQLCRRLWELYPTLNNSFRLAILNFLRLKSGNYRQEALDILRDSREDRELHFAAIRYLGKYPLESARPLLLQLLGSTSRDTWIYGAVSARSLAAYPGEETVAALKKALFSPQWYIRLNASESLEKLGVDYLKLADVINSTDRFAREIVQYRLEKMQRTAVS